VQSRNTESKEYRKKCKERRLSCEISSLLSMLFLCVTSVLSVSASVAGGAKCVGVLGSGVLMGAKQEDSPETLARAGLLQAGQDGHPFITRWLKQARPPAHLVDYHS